MAFISLSRHDINVLEKIRDPESDPSTTLLIDPSLPRDPVIIDSALYDRVSQREKDIILSMQAVEMQLAGLKTATAVPDPVNEYKTCVSRLDHLIAEHPRYASARNNRAQALRRLYGDTMLLCMPDSRGLIKAIEDHDRSRAVRIALSDLDEAIVLLTPGGVHRSVSPQAAKTLSLAHTQRAALYHMTAKNLSGGRRPDLDEHRKECKWTKIDFEEAASRDFAYGGRYGNEIAKGLAVSTNPTAKLCGQIVREAMKKEYGPAFEV
jgi:hypothetical protein